MLHYEIGPDSFIAKKDLLRHTDWLLSTFYHLFLEDMYIK